MADRKTWEYFVANVVAFDAANVDNHKLPIAPASADWWWKQKSGFHRFTWWQDAWWPIPNFLTDIGLQSWEVCGITPPDYTASGPLTYPNYYIVLKRPL